MRILIAILNFNFEFEFNVWAYLTSGNEVVSRSGPQVPLATCTPKLKLISTALFLLKESQPALLVKEQWANIPSLNQFLNENSGS